MDGRISDTGIDCLVLLARYHRLPADAEQIHHRFAHGRRPLSIGELVRAAYHVKLRAKVLEQSDADSLVDTPLPAMAQKRDGSHFVIARATAERVLVQMPGATTPETWPRETLEQQWNGRLMLTVPRTPRWVGARRFDIRWFIPPILKYRRHFTEVLAASFFLQLFALLTPLFFQVVVDKVLVHHALSTLDVLASGLAVLVVFDAVLSVLRTWLLNHTTNRIDVTLGAEYFARLLTLPMAWFRARRTGDIVARARELETIRSFITGSGLTLVIDIFFTGVFVAVMYYYSPILTGIVVATIPVYAILSLAVSPLLRHRLEQRFRCGAANQALLVETINGIETLKGLAVEPQIQRQWEEQSASYIHASFRADMIGNIATQIARLTDKTLTIAILWFGARLVIAQQLSVGQLIAFNMLAGRISSPILRLVRLWQDFQQASLSVARLGDVINTPPEGGLEANRAALPRIEGRIRFEHVSFRYAPERALALNNVDFTVQPGEMVGLVGRSGSGKSTVARLIQRLHLPESGRIVIDDTDIAITQPASLRRQIGVVAQENFLFNRSIRENIALADPGAPLTQVIAAARLAGAHEFISELPEGYDTVAGELGAALSGGQRQRVAIARALVNNPRILIFDEATSALDYESERILRENMPLIRRNRTVILIAHRLSTLQSADRILVLERGRLAESGSHEQLLASGGVYAGLYADQLTCSAA